jgi:hypothetical protein
MTCHWAQVMRPVTARMVAIFKAGLMFVMYWNSGGVTSSHAVAAVACFVD